MSSESGLSSWSTAAAVFDEFDDRLRASRKKEAERRRISAEGFSVFDFIQPSENVLSDILRFLLDPTESHGQGSEFLHLLLRRVRPDVQALPESATVSREALAYSIQARLRRIDVLVSMASFTIAIETKKFANEGIRQIEDYCRHLQNIASSKFCLIFLTRTGTDATSITSEARSNLTKTNLVSWSWERDVPAWLEECKKACKADKVRHFLDDFKAYIRAYLSEAVELREHDEA